MEINFYDTLEFIKGTLMTWNKVRIEDIDINQLPSTSNKVYIIQTKLDLVPNRLIYRIFGSDEVANRAIERRIFNKLALEGFGPRNYGNSDFSRLEQYLEGYAPMSYSDFYKENVIHNVSLKFKELHQIDITDLFGNKFPVIDQNIQKWKKIALDNIKAFEESGYMQEVQEILSERAWNIYENLVPSESPLVFSHLDTSPLNILLNSSTEQIILIDFEYSGYYYRSMDFGMMFTEAKFDYTVTDPPYYKYYSERAASDELVKEYILKYGEGKDMWIETKLSMICSQYVWAVWNLAMYKTQTNGFNYLSKALLRFNEFMSDYITLMQNGGKDYLERVANKLFSF